MTSEWQHNFKSNEIYKALEKHWGESENLPSEIAFKLPLKEEGKKRRGGIHFANGLFVIPVSTLLEMMKLRQDTSGHLLICHPGMLSRFSHVWLFATHGPPGSSVHGILQARILEWVAMPSSRGSSWPRDWAGISYVSHIGRQALYH